MPVNLIDSEEKVFKYLVEHKTPVLAETLAKRFIMSSSRIRTILRSLHAKGLADVVQVGSQKFYKLKD